MKIEDIVERIVAMSKVLYGLHMVSHNLWYIAALWNLNFLHVYNIHKCIHFNIFVENVMDSKLCFSST
jgi:membrane-associated PAP2 superfamily phosphatase